MFNLRGNCNLSGERRRKEGGNVFGEGTKTPISLTILVKKPNFKGSADIRYKDIGDYLNRTEKLNSITKFRSVLNPAMELASITPNEAGDWINKRSKVFETYIPIEPTSKFDLKSKSVFVVNSRGFETSRDVWSYNFSRENLSQNIQTTINFFNSQIVDFQKALTEKADLNLKDFITYDSSKISWSSSLFPHIMKGNIAKFEENKILVAQYRPFFKQYVYAGEKFVHRRGQFSQFFPTPQSKNLVICCSGIGVNKEFTAIITNIIPDLELIGKSQCFPLYYYDEPMKNRQRTLFDIDDGSRVRRDGISDFILQRCREEFGYKTTKEDIFFYIYGLLHSRQYREKFSPDLKKMLPRIPLVKDFWAFSKAGRKLADLHLGYENLPASNLVSLDIRENNYDVAKMRFPQKGKKDTIIYNQHITISNIPLRTYEYVVNGKSPIEWIMERYQITIDPNSKIENNPNLWGRESGDKKYIFNLLLKLITLSLETLDIMDSLPNISDELK